MEQVNGQSMLGELFGDKIGGAVESITSVIKEKVGSIGEILKYASEPLSRERRQSRTGGGQDYFGGKSGLDIADPLDLAYSTAASGYRLADRLFRRPLVIGGMSLGDKIQGLSGKDITSQEEFEEFAGRYDPEDSLGGAGYDVTYHGGEEKSGGNYFRPHGKDFMSQFIAQVPGVHIKPHKEGGGVAPITAAEEIYHGKRNVEDAFLKPNFKGGQSDVSDFFIRLGEETMAKGTALGGVAKNEGLLEAVLSIPSVASTYASYAIPSSGSYRIGTDYGSGKSKFNMWNLEGGEEHINRLQELYPTLSPAEAQSALHKEASEYRSKMFPDKDFMSIEGYEKLTEEEQDEGFEAFASYQKDKLGYDDMTTQNLTRTGIKADDYMERQQAGPLQTIKNWWDR